EMTLEGPIGLAIFETDQVIGGDGLPDRDARRRLLRLTRLRLSEARECGVYRSDQRRQVTLLDGVLGDVGCNHVTGEGNEVGGGRVLVRGHPDYLPLRPPPCT